MCYTYTYISPHYQWFELRVYSVSIASTDWHTVSLATYVCTTAGACAYELYTVFHYVCTTQLHMHVYEPHACCVSLRILLDYQPTLSLMGFIPDFSERLCTFNYSYQESCSLYPRCTSYFSVEYTVSPPPGVSNSSIGCSVEFTILNLMRCVSYQSTATALLANQRGNPVVVGDTVMLSE